MEKRGAGTDDMNAGTLPSSRGGRAAARHFAVGALRRWAGADLAEHADLADDAALVVTELAANAVVHARSGFTVTLSVPGDVLRISVRDASPLPSSGAGPALPPAPLHGLGAVDALASRWGVKSLGNAGKTVWVDLRRSCPAARPVVTAGRPVVTRREA